MTNKAMTANYTEPNAAKKIRSASCCYQIFCQHVKETDLIFGNDKLSLPPFD